MSFLHLFQDWRVGGAAATALVLPLIALQVITQANTNITTSGWTVPKINGFYSRVKLFLKNTGNINNSSNPTQASGGGITPVSQESGNPSQLKEIPDLIVEVPLNKLGQLESYKYCLPNSSKLKETVAVQKVNDSKTPTCELKFASNKTNEINSDSLNYLLDLITKYISVQHAANMVMFYDSKVNFSGSSQRLNTISSHCGLTNSPDKEILKDLFFQSTKNSKKCLPSPSEVELNLRLSSESSTSTTSVSETRDNNTNNIDKSRLSTGNVWGYLKYGVFDYWTTDLIPIPKNGNNEKKGKGLKVNFPVNYSLTAAELEKCSLEAFHKGVLKQEMRLEDLSNCAF